ncbi:MAG: enhanced entry protein EnhB [Legionellales bacterium]|nr:enhanced entry protein EnhB [Legionellales bacterium]
MFINFKLLLILLIQAIITTTIFASTFPKGCEVRGFGYSDNYLILNEKGQQSFYLIQNRSNHAIELEHHEPKDVFMSHKLHSKLDSFQWSAFASDVEGLYFKCFTQEGDLENSLKCSDVLDVCQYPRAKFALSNMGNYWVSSNKNQAQVIKESAAKGIFLHW